MDNFYQTKGNFPQKRFEWIKIKHLCSILIRLSTSIINLRLTNIGNTTCSMIPTVSMQHRNYGRLWYQQHLPMVSIRTTQWWKYTSKTFKRMIFQKPSILIQVFIPLRSYKWKCEFEEYWILEKMTSISWLTGRTHMSWITRHSSSVYNKTTIVWLACSMWLKICITQI